MEDIQAVDHEYESDLEQSLLTTWNAQVVDYDHDKYPFADWVLGRIRNMGYDLDDLTRLHEVVPDGEVYKVSKQLCADTNLQEFRRMLNAFTREIVVGKGKLRPPIAVQRFLNVRIMLPNKPEGIFPFHTGLLYGHGIASRSLWMPLTDVRADEDATASMQIIGTERSRELVRYAVENKLSVNEMTELFRKESWPIKAGPGSLCFFTQENIHGNFVNVTGKTRVSIDYRVAEAQHGDKLARKIPGGYFHVIPETDEDEKASLSVVDPAAFQNGKRNLLYLNNATGSTFGVPVHLQRYMVYEYCKKNNLNYEFELFELEDMAHLPTLQHVVHELKSNVVLYSIFSLPEDQAMRNKLLDAVLANGLILHFVNEDMVIANEADRREVEQMLEFAKFGTSGLPIGLPTSERIKTLMSSWGTAI